MKLAIFLHGFLLGMLPEKMEIMPYGVSISFKQREKEENKETIKFEIKKILIALAGPLINLIIIFITYNIENKFILYKQTIIFANLLILMFNLLPIYPLDGGRVLKGILHIFLKEEEKYINNISNFVAKLFTVFSSICTYYYKNISFFIITIFLWVLVLRENKKYKIKSRISRLLMQK